MRRSRTAFRRLVVPPYLFVLPHGFPANRCPLRRIMPWMENDMELRPLGRSGIDVPKLCVGSNVFGWTVDETASFRILDAFAEAGLTFIDTADVYSSWVPGNSGGESEAIIGRWMKERGNR